MQLLALAGVLLVVGAVALWRAPLSGALWQVLRPVVQMRFGGTAGDANASSAAALADIAAAVEAARDAQGQVPASLEPLLDRLSPRAAELARGGRIEYEPGEGRGDYEVALPLGAAR